MHAANPSEPVRIALAQRLRRVMPVLCPVEPQVLGEDLEDIVSMLKKLAQSCRARDDDSSVWLMLVAISAAIPSQDDVAELRSQLRLSSGERDLLGVLEAALSVSSNSRTLLYDIEIVRDEVLVDVDFAAKNGLNTGVQRVIRQTFSRWNDRYPHRLVVWTRDGKMLRNLIGREFDRVRNWQSSMRYEQESKFAPDGQTLVVPWNCVLVVPEVPQPDSIAGLRSIASVSGNQVLIIGHDAIPVLSPEYVLPEESERFAHFLGALKFAHRVVTVSHSAAAEFKGFCETLSSQGLVGPSISTVMLATEKVQPEKENSPELKRKDSSVPLVLCVGTQEPRKNQTSLLAAAEILWSSGVYFELLFIGSGSPPLSLGFDRGVLELQRRGRPVSVLRHASDREVAEAYDEALFTVLPSLHEGFGLPVAESLAHSTPVIVSNFGSVAEVAREGGSLLVNPRRPEEIADAMRELLTKPELVEALRGEANARTARSWDDYAADIWAESLGMLSS